MAKKSRLIARLQAMIAESGNTARSYSGRGMFGKACVAVSGDGVTLLYLAGKHRVPVPTMDSLGREQVVYWPAIAWERWLEETREGSAPTSPRPPPMPGEEVV